MTNINISRNTTISASITALVLASNLAYATQNQTAHLTQQTSASTTPATASGLPTIKAPDETSAVEERSVKESIIPADFFTIAFYKPNYIMPYYYTGSPYNSIYEGQTPQNEKLTRDEIKYQISLKVPIWKNILNHPSSLYLAYTQLSYWQAYNKSAFFRETDFEPELFLANEINYDLTKYFSINFVNIGAEHQSNGFGNDLERSWNRVYIEGVASSGNFMLSVKPWFIIHDNSLREHNPNIGSYLGYMQVLVAYKMDKQVINFRTYGLGVHGGRHTSAELSYSFPLTCYINGYVQLFSGYGQSLIEYDHRTNSAGVGIAFSNWI